MKALTRNGYGSPGIIHFKEVPKPQIAPDEILIRVHCNTVSRTDCGILGGKPFIFRFFVGWPKPKNPILGSDFAGEVVEIGPSVKGYNIGDRIFGFNDEGLGSQAEYLNIKADGPIMHIPSKNTYREAAAASEGAHYALNFLRYLNLPKGKKVLLIGATGAIGSAAIQILRSRGIRVDAVGEGAYRDYWQDRGVESYWDYKTEDFRKSGKQYAAVLDAVGKSNFFKCRKLLQKGGAYVSSELGPFASNLWLALIAPLMPLAFVKFPFPKDIPASLKEMQRLMAAGKFQALIDPVKLKPQDAEKAYHYACSGEKIGNLILDWDMD